MKKILSLLVVLTLILSLVACGGSAKAGELKIGRALTSAHGERGFTETTVVLNGDKIALVYIDEYQVLDKEGTITVPNSDGPFSEKIVEPTQAIASKVANDASYSALMQEKGGATQPLSASWTAIENYAVGKTAKELETEMSKIAEDGGPDAVAGSTLADTVGYVNSIVAAAGEASKATSVKFDGDVATLKIGQSTYSAHGDKAFASTVVVLDGDKVILSYIDEYQFMTKADVTGVPNSDKAFGESFQADSALASKRVNDKYYSANMKEKASATQPLSTNYDAIQAYANGKTIAELEGIAAGDAQAAIDAVAGSTLADTAGYVASIVAAAKAA